jgi:hypothetical protein
MLKGNLVFDGVSSIPAGLWTVAGSSDGVTAGFDGVDRWGNTYDYTKIPTGTNYGWITMTKTIGGKQVWLTLANKDLNFLGATLWGACLYTGTNSFAGAINNIPTFTASLSYNMPYSNNVASTYGDNFTVARRFYGGLSEDGTFWAAQSTSGNLETGMLFTAPVGCKVSDPYPFFFRAQAAGYTGGGMGQSFTNMGTIYSTTLFYNGVAGYHRVMPPTDSNLLDSTDFSVFDFPCFIEVYNNSTISSATLKHARGRIPDIGITTGNTAAASGTTRPVSTGVVFKDGNGDIQYVSMDYLILPYQYPVV